MGERHADAAGLARARRRLTVTVDPTLLDDLEWRGLIAHSTDLDALREASPRAACGSTSASTPRRRACTWATWSRSSPRAGSSRPATRRTPWSAAPPA